MKKLEVFYQKPFYLSEVNVYFTTLPICPYSYNENWFMIPLFADIEHQIALIGHELMHFMFYRYYKPYCEKRGLTFKEIEDIKEALTVFLNTEFSDIIKVFDKGYPAHQNLREFMLKKRKENKNFEKFLDAVIDWMLKKQKGG